MQARGKATNNLFTISPSRHSAVKNLISRDPVHYIERSLFDEEVFVKKEANFDLNSYTVSKKSSVSSFKKLLSNLSSTSTWKRRNPKAKWKRKKEFNNFIEKQTVIQHLKSSKKKKKNKLKRHRRSLDIPEKLRNTIRRKQLYCKTGFHLQILPNGKINGTRKDHDRYAVLEFGSNDNGYVIIRGVDSGKYLAMSRRGHLYGSNQVSEKTVFKETWLENFFSTYSSYRHRRKHRKKRCFVALNRHGKVRLGCRIKSKQKSAHFLLREVDPKKVPHLFKGELF